MGKKKSADREDTENTNTNTVEITEEEEEEISFEDMGLDPRLIRALTKKGIHKPTPIQSKAIPLILEGKDIVAQAKTGSGKTFAYVLPLLQKLFSENGATKKAPSAIVLVPSRELCQQVYNEILSFLEHCKGFWKVIQLSASMSPTDMRAAFAGPPEIVVTTPACIATCITKSILQPSFLGESLSTLILDEADLLLSYGYENDLKSLAPHIPRCCQCLLMSATSSADVEMLKSLVLHSPVILKLTEMVGDSEEIVPKSVQQFLITCVSSDKLLYILALLKLELVQKKALIFLNSIDSGFRLKLFLEQFGIKSAVLNAELPQNSRLHMLEEFNAGLFDYLIAVDVSKPENTEKQTNGEEKATDKISKKKRHKQSIDSEFGVVRGIDFKNVHTVINFEMPLSPSGYIHRIGRTGRAYSTGTSVSLVAPWEKTLLKDIKIALSGGQEMDIDSTKHISPFPLLTPSAVESLRYRAQDVAKCVTKLAVREARANELRNEMLNSEKLKAHFEDNPKDLELLKHDKILSKKKPATHLRAIPDYLVDASTQAASKAIKLAREAMGVQKPKGHGWFKRKGKGNRDPLKTFSLDSKQKRNNRNESRRDSEQPRKKHKKNA